MKRLITTGMAWGLCVSLHAQGAEQAPPSNAQINAVVQTLLLCEGLPEQTQSAEGQRIRQVLSHLSASQKSGANTGKYLVLGTEFQQFVATGYDASALFLAYSAQGQYEPFLRRLRDKGYKLSPFKPEEDGSGLFTKAGMLGHSLQRVTPDLATSVMLIKGPVDGVTSGASAQGISLMCSASPPTEELAQKTLGMPATESVRAVVRSREQRPREWAESVLATRHPSLLRALSDYRWLEPAQVDRLLAAQLHAVDQALVANTELPLTPAQLDVLLARHDPNVALALARLRDASLTPAQRAQLMQHPAAAEVLSLNQGDEGALRLLKGYLQADQMDKVKLAFAQMDPVPSQAVDLVLQHGSPAAKEWMAMDTQPAYTPAQVALMLADPSSTVQIGVLRRRSVAITREQYLQGLNHPDSNVVSWYQLRKEHLPTPEAIEKGLTSPGVPERRGWLFDERYRLTPAQIDRAWADPELRPALLSRKDWALSPDQANACMVDPAYSVRSTCVARADFELTDRRFKVVASDPNPNVLSALVRRPQPAVDWSPWVTSLINSANNLTLVSVAKARELPITEAHVRLAQGHPNPSVRQAFCARQPQVCAPGQPLQANAQAHDEWAQRAAIRSSSRALFSEERWQALTDMAQSTRGPKRLTGSGVWSSEHFYGGLTDALQPLLTDSELSSNLPVVRRKLMAWQVATPDEPASQLLLAHAMLAAADKVQRQAKGAARVPAAQRYLEQARLHLKAIQPLAAREPQWHVAMLEVALQQDWATSDIMALADEVLNKQPDLGPFHMAILRRLSPDRCGDAQAVERYALRVMKATEAQHGRSFYARIYWSLWGLDLGDRLFTHSAVQWPLMKAGFDDVVARHPVAWNLNHYANFACTAGDKPAAQAVLAKVKDHLNESLWHNRRDALRRCEWGL